MRPLRGLIVCVSTLLLVTAALTIRRSQRKHEDESTAARASRSRVRTLFSFHTPESLFPPSAIISLTDDNSTFFVARPAAYGSALPSGGLSGQLWIGSGFVGESTGRGGVAINAEGELGCSDIPGWPNAGDPQMQEPVGKQGGKAVNGDKRLDGAVKRPARAVDGSHTSRSKHGSSSPPVHRDGTDDHLHWPLQGAPLVRGASIHAKAHDAGGEEAKDKGHADIQSIQEGAEIAGKVVLLSRGGCGFLEKTKWVQRRGGVALIVGDNVRGASLTTMYANGDTSNVTIPSIFTSHMTAQLLSTLTPHEDLMTGRPLPGIMPPAKQPPPAEGYKATSPTRMEEGKNTASSGSRSRSHESWFARLANALGMGDSHGSEGRSHSHSSRLASGKHPRVEDVSSKKNSAGKQSQDGGLGSKVGAKQQDESTRDFVIGVHDWRDPDLVALQQEANQEARVKTAVPVATSIKSKIPATTDAKTKEFNGGNAVPGSGRYLFPSKSEEKVEDSPSDKENDGWFGGLFAPEVVEVTEEEALGIDFSTRVAASVPKANAPPPPPPLVDTPEPREGLWVTITPTTMTSSPFFDTLLVLVVSPLVTLTVVYALLLLRARIQRRRWRAPKSVVERLPVRTYHTMSSTSTSTSSSAPSVDASTANSPLLHPEHNSTLSRTRPRSRTTTSINESSSLTLERQREDLASRLEKKPYRGRQIECAVCLEEYVDGQSRVMRLPCGHEFHVDCITPWLTTRRRTCPICKGDVVRSLAASSSAANRSASPSPSRSSSAQVSRAHSIERRGTPQSDTPLLGRRADDLEGGRDGGLPVRSAWTAVTGAVSRLMGRGQRQDDTLADRDR